MLRKTLGSSLFVFGVVLCVIHTSRAGTSDATNPARILRHYPAAGAIEVPCATNIGITASEPFDETVASTQQWVVTGSRSGIHSGIIVLSDDRRTAIFKPFTPFALLDTVYVSMISQTGSGAKVTCSFRFISAVRVLSPSIIASLANVSSAANSPHLNDVPPPPDTIATPPPDTISAPPPDTIMPPPPDTITVPPPDSLPPPPPDSMLPPPNQWGLITAVNTKPTPGRIFLSIIPGHAPPYGLMITDENSNALLSLPVLASDFILQPNGQMTCFDPAVDSGVYYAIDSQGQAGQIYRCTNGVTTDGHELIVQKDGGYTLIGLSFTYQDMSAFQGQANAIIQGGVLQTFDPSGNLIFEWRGIDSGHYLVQDDIEPGDLKDSPIDFEHANSIDIDSDGNYLLSNRNLSEITKIDGTTGDIIWRFGGNHNQFKFVGDTLGISCQHYVRWLKNGDILLFDNGVYHATPESRAVEYVLDTNDMTATLKWQYHHTPPLFSDVMGDAERLDNGNTFIGWGSNVAVAATEVDSNGKVVYEMEIPQAGGSYRAIKYPTKAPASGVATQQLPDGLTLSIAPASIGYDLTVTAEGFSNASVVLCDVAGRVVQNVFDGDISPEPQHIPLSTSSLVTGVYFCVLHSSEGQVMRPVLVTH